MLWESSIYILRTYNSFYNAYTSSSSFLLLRYMKNRQAQLINVLENLWPKADILNCFEEEVLTPRAVPKTSHYINNYKQNTITSLSVNWIKKIFIRKIFNVKFWLATLGWGLTTCSVSLCQYNLKVFSSW